MVEAIRQTSQSKLEKGFMWDHPPINYPAHMQDGNFSPRPSVPGQRLSPVLYI